MSEKPLFEDTDDIEATYAPDKVPKGDDEVTATTSAAGLGGGPLGTTTAGAAGGPAGAGPVVGAAGLAAASEGEEAEERTG
jgi:hypothetical protein